MTRQGEATIKLKDVAKAAGVSQGTASNVFSKPDAPVTERNRRFTSGLLSPLTGIVATIARRRRAPARHFGVHAYD